MIPRPDALSRIGLAFRAHPVVALLGPRQCGKTTLARIFEEHKAYNHFDLEDPVDIRRLSEPVRALEGLSGLVVIDEIQAPARPI